MVEFVDFIVRLWFIGFIHPSDVGSRRLDHQLEEIVIVPSLAVLFDVIVILSQPLILSVLALA